MVPQKIKNQSDNKVAVSCLGTSTYPPSISFITVSIVVGFVVQHCKSIRCVKALIEPVRRLSRLFDESILFVKRIIHNTRVS